jgi:hypothetical protein
MRTIKKGLKCHSSFEKILKLIDQDLINQKIAEKANSDLDLINK